MKGGTLFIRRKYMTLEELQKMSTDAHEVLEYNEEEKILSGALIFDKDYDIKSYVRWVAFYLYDICKIPYDAQKRLNDASYKIFFELVYDWMKPNNVYLSDDEKYVLEYDICLNGICDMRKAISYLDEVKMEKVRRRGATQEEKISIDAAIDILQVIQKLKSVYDEESGGLYLARLAQIAKNAKK